MSRLPIPIRVLSLCMLFPLATACTHSSQASDPHERSAIPAVTQLRLDDVTVVDTASGTSSGHMSVLMSHGRVVNVAPTETIVPDSAVHVINASGKFVVPGFNDMHSHALTAPNASGVLALMLSEGVTGFRQMDGSPDPLAARRNGSLHLGADAPGLLAMPGSLLTAFNAVSPEGVAAEVRRQKKQGADFIKVAAVSPPVFYAAIAEATRVGLPALGHLQEGVDSAQASRAGFRSIEHLGPGDTMWVGCSTQQAALLAEAIEHPRLKGLPFPIPGFIQKLFAGKIQKILLNPAAFEEPNDVARLQRALDTYSDTKCRALAATFVANGTWQVPTLVRLRTQYLADSPEYDRDPSLAYITPDAQANWRDVTKRFRAMPAAVLATDRQTYPRELQLTKLFADAGVSMMTGTDSGGQVPGQSMLQEFDELAKAGLQPLKILQMATTEPARFLGRSATMGRVAVGNDADLVLLDANPLDGVENMHRIYAVVRAGFYHSAADLQALRSRVAAGKGVLN